MSEKIIVSEQSNPVTLLEKGKDRNTKLGTLVSRIYEGEDVQRHEFRPNGSDEGAILLRPTQRGNLSFLNHWEAQKPLVEAGYEMLTNFVGKGGLVSRSVWRPAKPEEFDDPITWDHHLWEKKQKKLQSMVVLTTSIDPSKGVSYEQGLFRLICQNGLVDQAYKLGRLRFRPDNFDAGVLAEELFGRPVQVANLKGDYVGTGKGAGKLRNLIAALMVEDAKKSIDELPQYVKKMLSPFVAMPNWYLKRLVEQLEILSKAGNKIHTLDLNCAITNAVSLETLENEDRNFIRPLARNSAMAKEGAALIGIYSL